MIRKKGLLKNKEGNNINSGSYFIYVTFYFSLICTLIANPTNCDQKSLH